MSNVVDIVRAAQDREYTKFEELAKDMLKQKVAENSTIQATMAELNAIKEAKGEKPEEENKDSYEGEEDEEGEEEE